MKEKKSQIAVYTKLKSNIMARIIASINRVSIVDKQLRGTGFHMNIGDRYFKDKVLTCLSQW